MTDPSWLSWNIPAGDFPFEGSTKEKLHFALQYAVLAPSGHNTQPWLFRVENGAVQLFADRTRRLSVLDPDDRELTMSCGAALFHLHVTLRHFGCGVAVEILPDPGEPDLLAQVRLGRPMDAFGEEHLLFQAIPERHTKRLPFEDRPLPDSLLCELEAAAAAHGAWLNLVQEEGQRNAIADLIARADRQQLADNRIRRELNVWIHRTPDHSHDGVPAYAIGFADLVDRARSLVGPPLGLDKRLAARDRQLAASSPVLAVLGTEDDTPRDWVNAGQALDRVLLRASVEGVWASFLNQPIEVAEMRPVLRDLIGRTGYPQLLLRLGYGAKPAPTPRRPLKSVLLHSPVQSSLFRHSEGVQNE